MRDGKSPWRAYRNAIRWLAGNYLLILATKVVPDDAEYLGHVADAVQRAAGNVSKDMRERRRDLAPPPRKGPGKA